MINQPVSIALMAQIALGFGPPEQLAFPRPVTNDGSDLIYKLHRAEIIPTVLDDFHPAISVSIDWREAHAETGNTVPPSKLQDAPEVRLAMISDKTRVGESTGMQLTIALTDPDAPSRDNPEWSQICHWIMTGLSIEASTVTGDARDATFDIVPAQNLHDSTRAQEEVMPYKPPGPPPKTGKHRYVFVALAPSNGTKEYLHLSKPGDRQQWGYDKERAGLREWAEENGLSVVGANFVYAQNKEQ